MKPADTEQAEREQWSYRDFLAVRVAEEVAHRQHTRVQRLTRRARFPSSVDTQNRPLIDT